MVFTFVMVISQNAIVFPMVYKINIVWIDLHNNKTEFSRMFCSGNLIMHSSVLFLLCTNLLRVLLKYSILYRIIMSLLLII